MEYQLPGNIPDNVHIDIMLQAQDAALAATHHLPKNHTRIELFWVRFNFEMRKLTERWIRINANVKT